MRSMANMKRNVLKIVNPVIGILFITQAGSGLLHRAIPYETYELIHEFGGYLFSATIALHIVLNRSWFTAAFRSRK